MFAFSSVGVVNIGQGQCVHANPADAEDDKFCNFGDKVFKVQVLKILYDVSLFILYCFTAYASCFVLCGSC